MVEPKKETQNDQETPSLQKVKISGRFDQYRSSYWAALVALMPVRYLIRPFNRKHWDSPQPGEAEPTHFQKHAYSGIAGVFMSGVTSFYAYKTWRDMKSIFSETLAWEFNKQPEDVTFGDFRRSQNTIVKQTIDNYIKYNLRRFGVNTAFFAPFLLKGVAKKHNWHPETGVDIGVGANALYLFSDVLTRQMTPFEELQSLIDRKVNHAERFGDQVTAADLLDVYERHATKGPIDSFVPMRGKPEWEKVNAMFERMADLMNQTYRNTVPREKADFGFPKFVYLVGNGLIDPAHMERSCAYIEIANRDGVKAARALEAELKQGKPLAQALGDRTITLPEYDALECAPAPIAERPAAGREALLTKAPLASKVEAELLRKAQPAGLQLGS